MLNAQGKPSESRFAMHTVAETWSLSSSLGTALGCYKHLLEQCLAFVKGTHTSMFSVWLLRSCLPPAQALLGCKGAQTPPLLCIQKCPVLQECTPPGSPTAYFPQCRKQFNTFEDFSKTGLGLTSTTKNNEGQGTGRSPAAHASIRSTQSKPCKVVS